MLGVPFIVDFSIVKLSQNGIVPSFNNTQIMLFTNILVYVTLSLIILIIAHKKFSEDIKKFSKTIKWLIPMILIVYATSTLGGVLISIIDHTKTTSNQAMILDMQSSNYLITTIIIIICAPIVEETTFRYSFIGGKNGFMSIIFLLISSLLFGLVHVAKFTPGALVAYSLVGFALGMIYLKFNNILLNILVHSGYNIFILLIMYLINKS